MFEKPRVLRKNLDLVINQQINKGISSLSNW